MRHAYRILLVALLVAIIAPDAHAQRKRQPSPFVGKEFPNFTATDPISGKKFQLKDYRGKVVLLDFWATWCGPCVRELPNVKQARAHYRDRGFEVISISLDSDAGRFRDFVKRQRMDWPHVMEGGGWKTRLAKKYRIRSIPAMFIIDHDGICRTDRARGSALEREIEKALAKLEAAGGSEAAGPPQRPGSDTGAGDTAAVTDLRRRVRDARATLAAIARQDNGLRVRLDAVEQNLRMLDSDLPVPDDVAAAQRRYERMHDGLVTLRRDLFMCGCLNDHLVTLPANPFAEDGVSLKQAFVAAAAELPKARKALGELRLADAGESAHARRLRSALDGIEAELRGRGADVVTLSVRLDDVTKEVGEYEERCRNPWTEQLLVADTVVAGLAGGGGSMRAQMDELAGKIIECRLQFEAAGGQSSELIALRDDFHVVCKELAGLVEQLRRAGVAGADDIDLPENPLVSGRLRDIRTRIETGEQIGRASRALEDLRELNSAADAQMAAYEREIRSMQTEYARLSQAQDPDLTALEQRFRRLCAEILDVLERG
jgi:peroxiredoxin